MKAGKHFMSYKDSLFVTVIVFAAVAVAAASFESLPFAKHAWAEIPYVIIWIAVGINMGWGILALKKYLYGNRQ